jgi:putative DNA primase/helicase
MDHVARSPKDSNPSGDTRENNLSSTLAGAAVPGGSFVPNGIDMQPAVDPRTKLDWALWAISATPFYIFPLRPNTRKPLLKGAMYDGSRDPERIKTWWAATPEANIGYAYFLSGHSIIDIDVKGDAPGLDTWRTLCAEHGEFPTFCIRTGSGGFHVVYDDADAYVQTKGSVWPGIDTRGVGGLGVGVGSTIDGKPYTIHNDAPIAKLPAWIRDHFGKTAKERQERVRKTENPDFEPDHNWIIAEAKEYLGIQYASEGPWGQDDPPDTYAIAARLHDLGVSEAKAVELMMDGAGGNRSWLATCVGNAYRYAQNDFGCDRPYIASERFPASEEMLADIARVQAEHKAARKSLIRWGRPEDAEPIVWLWKDWLARGMLHLIGGHKGAGKSTTAIDLLAQISAGGVWPDGTPAPYGRCLIWSSEDSWNVTIAPRIIAAGGDISRVGCITDVPTVGGGTRPFSPAHDIPALLEAAAGVPDLKAIMIDPIVSAVGGGRKGNSNEDVRAALDPIVRMAEERGAVVIGITHLSKGTQGQRAGERIIGSVAYTAVARMVLACVRGPNKDDPRRLVRLDGNISSEEGGGFEYRIETKVIERGIKTSRIAWGAKLEGPGQVLMDELEGGGKKKTLLQEAMAFLDETVTEAGVMVKDLKQQVRAEERFSWATVEDAFERMPDIQVRRTVGGDRRAKMWHRVRENTRKSQ